MFNDYIVVITVSSYDNIPIKKVLDIQTPEREFRTYMYMDENGEISFKTTPENEFLLQKYKENIWENVMA